MALTRKDNIIPEEQLLRLIEQPTVIDVAQSQMMPGKGADIAIPLLGKKSFFSKFAFLPIYLIVLSKNLSLKTINKVCLIAIISLLGYAIWSVVSAESVLMLEVSKLEWMVEEPRYPGIEFYYGAVDTRDIFKDMYKPPPPVVPKESVVPPTPGGTTVPDAPQITVSLTEVLKKIKLIGVCWEPKPVVLIKDETRNLVHCLKEGETFQTSFESQGTTRDVIIEIVKISKNQVALRYENQDGTLTLSE
jgi:hypothetical protein